MTGQNGGVAASIADVLKRYSVGILKTAKRIPKGLIHQTFFVETTSGKYVLQRLHPDLSTDGQLLDYQAVTDHLAGLAFSSPRLILAADGGAAVEAEGGRYRLITFLGGDSYDAVEDERMAAEAARMMGEFHVAMAEFRHAFAGGRPLHDSPAQYLAFCGAVEKYKQHPLMAEAAREAALVEKNLPRHFFPDPLPGRVVHGDPKISNILFDPKDRQACGIVDLDSCGRHTVLVDIGDAARSWCREGPEDEPTPFLAGRFKALCDGYRQSGAPLSRTEKELIVRSCRLITLELASRFLRDVFEDRYFGWDPSRFPTRPAHNLARARGCLALYESMAGQEGVMEKIVRENI